jgi:hypothetical protein
MQVKAHVVGEHRDEFSRKRGKGVHFILFCIDCDTKTPFDDMFDFDNFARSALRGLSAV